MPCVKRNAVFLHLKEFFKSKDLSNMKKTAANASPLKGFIGLHEGKLAVFVSAFPIPTIQPRHFRDEPPPKIDPNNLMQTLKQLENYYK
jgi:hypothetical protein